MLLARVAAGPIIAAVLAAMIRPAPPVLPAVLPNDNRVAAGTPRGPVLELRLDAREGVWHPFGDAGAGIPILAFGERGKPLQTPGPMIRVRRGTRVRVRIANHARATLVVHGLADRRRASMDTLVVPAGAERDVAFTADAEGTYYYWGSTTGADFEHRLFEDAFLDGALIVDPPAPAPVRPDRIFVIQWYVPGMNAAGEPDLDNGFFSFNGRPWPYDEHLAYAQGDSIRWRFINATADVHPLHLHGFYFRISARGDERQDTLYWPAQQRLGVTEPMWDGSTMDIAWRADRPGGWIFHCHLNWHVVRNPLVGAAKMTDSARTHELLSPPEPMYGAGHEHNGMGGLVLAVNIRPAPGYRPYDGPRRELRLYIRTDSAPGDTARRFGYSLVEGHGAPPDDSLRVPGPPIVLHRGEPTRIWVINRSTEPSQVHWHGLEIESYYDGVAGVSGGAGRLAPAIMPGDSFEVRVTPPRAGSFMYHTHLDDIRQQSHGLYGPIIVLDSGATWSPETDRIFQLGTDPTDSPVLDGSAHPPDLTLHAGTTYRLRLMNITLDSPGAQLVLLRDGAPVQWTALAKDGHDLPPWQRTTRAASQPVSIGETYDFTFSTPKPGGDLAMEVQSRRGALLARQTIHVVP